MWPFASQFRRTNTPSQCSCIWADEYLRTWCTQEIQNVPRGSQKYCGIAPAGWVVDETKTDSYAKPLSLRRARAGRSRRGLVERVRDLHKHCKRCAREILLSLRPLGKTSVRRGDRPTLRFPRGTINCLDQSDASPAIASVADRRCIVLDGMKKILKQRLVSPDVTHHRR